MEYLTQEENQTVIEVSKYINEEWLKLKCPKNLHMISQTAEEVMQKSM